MYCEQQNERLGGKEEQKGKKETYGAISQSLIFMSCESQKRQERREAVESVGMAAGDLPPEVP